MRTIIKDKRVKDYSEILLSKLIIVMLSFLTGFLIPAALSIEDYGYYSLFALFISYLGIFHFGFIDGLYLKYGKLDMDELPHSEYRYFARYLIFEQVLFMVLSIIVINNFLSFDTNTKFILTFAAINMLAVNLQAFFNRTSLGTRNVRYPAITGILQKLIISVFALSTLFITIDIVSIVIVLTISNYIVFLIGLYHYRRLIFGKATKGKLFELYKFGIPLLIANYIGIFIISMDRLFISTYYTIESLSYYSFALTMLIIIDTIVNSLYQMLYPNVSRLSENNKKNLYQVLSVILIIVTVFGVSGYYVLEFLIPIILPKYVESLQFLAVLLPAFIFRVDAGVAKKSYIYTDKRQKGSILINTLTLIIGVLLNYYFIYSGKNVIYVAYATLISLVIWSLLLEIFFSHKGYSFNIMKYVYVALCLSVFFILNAMPLYSIIKFVLYIIIVLFITLLLQRKILFNIISFVKNG